MFSMAFGRDALSFSKSGFRGGRWGTPLAGCSRDRELSASGYATNRAA